MIPVPDEVITELAKRWGNDIDTARDVIDKFLLERARQLIGVPLVDALEAVHASRGEYDFWGTQSESHLCIDCGFNTAPGCLNRAEMERTAKEHGPGWSIPIEVGIDTEMYMVRDAIWKKAGMTPWGGCLCIGCLEKRIGRRLKPKDFTDHAFNQMPGTPRLLNRRDRDFKGSFVLQPDPQTKEFRAYVSSDECLGTFKTADEAGKALYKRRGRT
jgi:hypothetical protein